MPHRHSSPRRWTPRTAFWSYRPHRTGASSLGRSSRQVRSAVGRESRPACLLDVATRQFTPVGEASTVSPMTAPFPEADCISSDERYVVCEDQAAPATTGLPEMSPALATLWSYDLVSKQARRITDTDHYAFAGKVLESHSTLVFSAGKQVYLVDLATNAIASLPTPSPGPFAIGFSWPYLVYFDQPDPAQPTKVRARDLATGEDIALPQVDALYAATNNAAGNHIPYLV